VSKLLEMQQMQNYSYDEAHSGYGDANVVEFDYGLRRFNVTAFELIQSGQNQMFSDTRVSAGRFTWSDDSLRSNVHSANFAGMDASGVVATGSWSSPSEDFFAGVSNNGHAVPGFDFIDITPADYIFLDGVRNGYAFIENRDFGAIDNQVDDTAKAGRPDSRNNATSQTAAHPRLNIEAKNQHKNEASTISTRLSSEDFGIAHAHFIDHEVMVAYQGGDLRG
jgi:hypothetical protein